MSIIRTRAVVVIAGVFASVGVAVTAPAAVAAPAAKTYPNCAALNKAYPHGVGRKGAVDKVAPKGKRVTNFTVNTAVYNKNTKSDRDKDGIACEKR